MHITTVQEFRGAIKYGKYCWPGGYPLFFRTSDSGVLCVDCGNKERRNIIHSIGHDVSDGWQVNYIDVNWEDELHCDHCNDMIEAAYI